MAVSMPRARLEGGVGRLGTIHVPRVFQTAKAAPSRLVGSSSGVAWRGRPNVGAQNLAEVADSAEVVKTALAVSDMSSSLQIILPVAAVLGLLAYRFTLYGQLEFITASMLTRYVPKTGNGPIVIQCGGGTRELYYYPKNTVQVNVVGEDVNASLLEQAGMQAAVPTVARKQRAASLSFASDNSIDAVIALKTMGSLGTFYNPDFLDEALRVLKPGCPLIFLEKIYEGGSPLRPLIGQSGGGSVSVTTLESMREKVNQWEFVQWDVALEGQDPHAVGVAVKASKFQAPKKPSQARPPKEKAPSDLPKPKAPTSNARGFSATKEDK